MADLDALLEGIQPPSYFLDQLNPAGSLSVSAFLSLAVPQRFGGQKTKLKPEEWFTTNEVNGEMKNIEELILPEASLCSGLDSLLSSAVCQGAISVRHPTKESTYLPLWTVRAWKRGSLLLGRYQSWQRCIEWIKRMSLAEGWDKETYIRTYNAISQSPQNSGFLSLQKGTVYASSLSRMLLSTEWLDDSAVDASLDTVREDMSKSNVSPDVCVAGTTLAISSPHSNIRTYWGKRLQDGKVHRLLMPCNIKDRHWIALEIDVATGCILVGDSLPTADLTQSVSDTIDNITVWLNTYLPQRVWRIDLDGLPSGLQQDGYSCGIAVVNTIHRRVLPLVPAWSAVQPSHARAVYYSRCIELGLGIQSPFSPIKSIPLPELSSFDKEVSQQDTTYEAVQSCTVAVDSAVVHQTTLESEETQAKKLAAEGTRCLGPDNRSSAGRDRKRRSDHDSDVGGYDTDCEKKVIKSVEQAKKRREKRRLPKPKKSLPSCTSRIKVTLKKALPVAIEPPWFSEPAFKTFKAKVLKTHPSARFHTKDRKQVWCSFCAKYVTMRADATNDVQRWKEHLRSKGHQKASPGNTRLVDLFAQAREKAKKARTGPCPGLTPDQDARILRYLSRTQEPFGGATPRWKIQRELRAGHVAQHSVTGKVLTPKRLAKLVQATERSRATWLNDYKNVAVYSTRCLQASTFSASGEPEPCVKCLEVLKNQVFRNALSRRGSSKGNWKYTPKCFRNKIVGESYLRSIDVQEFTDMNKEKHRWLMLAKNTASGKYKKKYPVFVGIAEMIMKIEDRIAKGKKLTNMTYDASWDTVCTTLALVSPRAYRLLRGELGGGRSLRSMARLRAKKGRILPGIEDANFDNAVEWMKKLNYSGPLALSTDDTKLVAALRSYQDQSVWRLVGMHGKTEVFASYEELLAKASEVSKDELADKVRIWLLSIPLSKIPPFVVAMLSISSRVTRGELRGWHDLIQSKLQDRGIHIVSYNVDGASVERGISHSIHDDAVASGRVRTWTFQHPDPDRAHIILQAPLLSNGLPCILSEDGKHARKNSRGSVTSGARIVVLGEYTVHIGQLIKIVESEGSPLLRTDILGVDKQDDRAGARFSSASVVEHVTRTQPDELGLIIYLFIMGELIDAQQNRTLGHEERMQMLWRGLFFLEGWFVHVKHHPFYSIDTHFITRQLYDILLIYTRGMLMLVLVYRDHFPDIPLLPWLHSTEAAEHFFGCARKIQQDFNFAEAVLMVHKLMTLMESEIRSALKSAQESASKGRAGYHHTWFEAKGVDYAKLATYPSDKEISALLRRAYYEASSLLQILGMDISNPNGGPGIDKRAFWESLEGLSSWPYGDLDGNRADEDGEDSELEDEESLDIGNKLETLLAADAEEIDSASHTNAVDDELASLGFAAAAATIHNALQLEEISDSEVQDAENALTEYQKQLEAALQAVKIDQDRRLRSDVASRMADNPAFSLIDLEETAAADATSRAAVSVPEGIPDGATDFGTAARFNYEAVVNIRRKHETSEARSAITYRYRHALSGQDLIDAATANVTHGTAESKHDSPEKPPSTSTVKAQLVFEITRVLSSSLTSTSGKLDTSGLSRLARWQAMGVISAKENASSATDTTAGGSGPSNRSPYQPLELRNPSFAFRTAGISEAVPLKQGSIVAVAFRGHLYLGQVLNVHIKGGGKKPTHNYSDNCFDISHLSRFTVLLHTAMAEGGQGWLSPVMKTADGRVLNSTYLFLHGENLVISLDGLTGSDAVKRLMSIRHNQWILQASSTLQRKWIDLQRLETEIIKAADATMKLARSRKKRPAPSGDDEGELDDEPEDVS